MSANGQMGIGTRRRASAQAPAPAQTAIQAMSRSSAGPPGAARGTGARPGVKERQVRAGRRIEAAGEIRLAAVHPAGRRGADSRSIPGPCAVTSLKKATTAIRPARPPIPKRASWFDGSPGVNTRRTAIGRLSAVMPRERARTEPETRVPRARVAATSATAIHHPRTCTWRPTTQRPARSRGASRSSPAAGRGARRRGATAIPRLPGRRPTPPRAAAARMPDHDGDDDESVASSTGPSEERRAVQRPGQSLARRSWSIQSNQMSRPVNGNVPANTAPTIATPTSAAPPQQMCPGLCLRHLEGRDERGLDARHRRWPAVRLEVPLDRWRCAGAGTDRTVRIRKRTARAGRCRRGSPPRTAAKGGPAGWRGRREAARATAAAAPAASQPMMTTPAGSIARHPDEREHGGRIEERQVVAGPPRKSRGGMAADRPASVGRLERSRRRRPTDRRAAGSGPR